MSTALDFASASRIRDLVGTRFGLYIDDARFAELADLLARRAIQAGADASDYISVIERDERGELGRLATQLTVGETYFFRNGEQFRALAENVLPDRMQARAGEKRLAVLSAGCSSGEEPYSIAMLVRDAVASPPWGIAIHAVDLNAGALERAAAARYAPWSMRETPADLARRWFAQHGREHHLSDQIRGAVSFAQANLADPDADIWRPGNWDVIFCRNVIMYFRPEVQRQVIASAAAALAEGGYLFLGHAETLRGLSQDFDLVGTHGTFYYRRRGGTRAKGPRVPRAGHGTAAPALPPMPQSEIATAGAAVPWFEAIGAASRRIQQIARRPPPPVPGKAGPRAGLEVAIGLMRQERFAEALDLIDAMSPANRRDPDILLLQATLLAQAGRLAAAGEACRQLLEDDALSAGASYVLGLCFEGLGERDDALARYRLAAHLDPDFAMPVLRCGLLARQAGESEAASRDLERAADLLEREDPARLLLFGGGFTRQQLMRLCAPPRAQRRRIA